MVTELTEECSSISCKAKPISRKLQSFGETLPQEMEFT